MAKCGCCNSTILLGGTEWAAWEFCGEDCIIRMKQELAKKCLPADLVESETRSLHEGNCPTCGGAGPNDTYRTWTVTGMILAVQYGRQRHICCKSCARKAKLKAFLHCLALGWWSPRALLTNLVYVPFSLISIFLVSSTPVPSNALKNLVSEILVEKNLPAIIKSLRSGA